MKKVAIVDYGMGNLDSVRRIIEYCDAEVILAGREKDLEAANYIVLPGVGSFADGMKNISERGLDKALNEQVLENKIPFLGICLGMQLLGLNSHEGGVTKGFGWIDGVVRRLAPSDKSERIPHIGWNEVIFDQASPLFEGIGSGKDFYFVHSYQFLCDDKKNVIAHTTYAGGFISAINKENIYGVQFHPEKSQRAGLKLIKNFLNLQGSYA